MWSNKFYFKLKIVEHEIWKKEKKKEEDTWVTLGWFDVDRQILTGDVFYHPFVLILFFLNMMANK